MTQKSAIDVQQKLYQKDVLERIATLTTDRPDLTAPFVVELDPTAACDLACPGCISEDIIAAGGRFSDERLLSLGSEMAEAGVRGVILIGGGEPLAHPAIGRFIRMMGERDVHIGITTNGTFVDRYLDEIAEFAFWTRVSMDAATQTTFDALRPPKAGKSKFDRIVSNMRTLAERKKGLLGFSFLVQSPADGEGVVDNSGEIFDAALLARDIGCDYFEVKPTYQFRDDVPHALMKHDADFRAGAAEQIARLSALETESFKVYQAINMQSSLAGVDTPQEKQYQHCPAAMLRTLITPKGAYVCPYWRGKQAFRIGNVEHQSFSEMWQGLQRMAVMKELNPSQQCNFHCLRHGSNEQVIGLKEKLDAGVPVKSLEPYDRFL